MAIQIRVLSSSLAAIVLGTAIGWQYNNSTRIAEFYVYKGNPSSTQASSGFMCKCFNSGGGSLNWIGRSTANCSNKIGVLAVPLPSGKPVTPGACCQGTALPTPNKKSPVINNIPIFTNNDPCHV